MNDRRKALRRAVVDGRRQGLSAGQMAKALSVRFEDAGITRNVVLGILYRAGMCAKGRQGHGDFIQLRERRRIERQAARRSHVETDRRPYTPEPVPERLVDMEALEDHHCRYVHGDPGDGRWGYCGSQREPGGPYCQHHAAKCYARTIPERAAESQETPSPILQGA